MMGTAAENVRRVQLAETPLIVTVICQERYAQQTQPTSTHLDYCSLLNHDSTPVFLLFLLSVMPSSVVVHIEVRLLSSTNIRLDSVSRWVYDWLQSNFISLSICQEIKSFGNAS